MWADSVHCLAFQLKAYQEEHHPIKKKEFFQNCSLLILGMGWVHVYALGSGFGIWDLSWVGSQVNAIWFGSSSGIIFFSFFSQFWLNFAKISNIQGKIFLWVNEKFLLVTWVHTNISRVGLVWPKWPRVGSNLGSGFDPTHP